MIIYQWVVSYEYWSINNQRWMPSRMPFITEDHAADYKALISERDAFQHITIEQEAMGTDEFE